MIKKTKYAVFDLDGTLLRWQLFHSVVDYLASQNKISPDLYDEVKYARKNWHQRKHPDAFSRYELKIIQAYDSIVGNLSMKEFEEIAKKVFDVHKDETYVYTKNLMKELRKKGYMLFAISGSFDVIVQMIAKYYRFDDSAGSSHAIKRGRFTGEIDVVQHDRKVDKIRELELKYELSQKDSVAIGDSMGDLAMLKYVHSPIVFNPVDKLFEEAIKRHWKIVIERKNMIYKLVENKGQYILDI